MTAPPTAIQRSTESTGESLVQTPVALTSSVQLPDPTLARTTRTPAAKTTATAIHPGGFPAAVARSWIDPSRGSARHGSPHEESSAQHQREQQRHTQGEDGGERDADRHRLEGAAHRLAEEALQ